MPCGLKTYKFLFFEIVEIQHQCVQILFIFVFVHKYNRNVFLTHSLPPKFIYPSSEAEFSCNTCTDHGRTVIVNLGYHTYTSFLQQ